MIGQDSRYAGCVLYVDGSDEFVGSRQRIDTTPRPDDVFHSVVEGDRVDLIAYRYWGRTDLWWVVCDYNDIACPVELGTGAVLRLPSLEYLPPLPPTTRTFTRASGRSWGPGKASDLCGRTSERACTSWSLNPTTPCSMGFSDMK